MIPRKIHYCWFGSKPTSPRINRCMRSWQKYCNNYQIIEWNESNFDVNQNSFTSYCYHNKLYAFLSDYARLKIIFEEGGIYLDTDVEIIRPFDDLLCYNAFFGFENDSHVATGLGFGAEAKHPVVFKMLQEYDFFLLNPMQPVACPILNTQALLQFGLIQNGLLQQLNNVIIFPREYLNPFDNINGVLTITPNTYSIHWYSMSWLKPSLRIRNKFVRPVKRILGKNCFSWIKQILHM